MRSSALCLIFALAAPFSLRAQAPAAPTVRHSLNMEVTVGSTGGASSFVGGDRAATPPPLPLRMAPGATFEATAQKRDKQSALGLTVEVRNLARTADTAVIDWYFVAKPVNRGDQYIYDSGSQEVNVAASSSTKTAIASQPLQTTTVRQSLTVNGVNQFTGQQIRPEAIVRKEGASVGGWIVRLLVDGKPAVVRASSPALEQLGKDEQRLAAFPRK